jgi:hypothetical protein
MNKEITDTDRLNWLELTASGITWQLTTTGLITREAIDKCLTDARAEEMEDEKRKLFMLEDNKPWLNRD